eukprot:CAMPEP_0178446900 /NCGR_PEP_ID=MMETSP0689_2-20121128/41079_1 /TAXON_ID=160604 /ORGANISM="Amphidinium massartii, Strain CS-259" /LENGTH=80 /DNA_ID=CAMNT_0020071813 /DNA_START=456 /DNA_END=695 /DNA_ORIENTATION=-
MSDASIHQAGVQNNEGAALQDPSLREVKRLQVQLFSCPDFPQVMSSAPQETKQFYKLIIQHHLSKLVLGGSLRPPAGRQA